MQIDAEEIRRALKAFFVKGDVFEIRVLDAITRSSNGYTSQPHVESGYFDFDHIEDVPAALEHIKFAKGVYVTANPVDNSLLARAANRLRNAKRAPATSDNDILRRRWLLIDCDAERKSDISSSDEEHIAAEMKAREIRNYMTGVGWPMPILTDSGNGAQLMYAIDLPTNDEGIVARILKVLSGLSTNKVKIDTTVSNASRIWRLPGTMNCKGDSVPDRPHRMAKIIELPDTIEFVSYEQLIEACRWQAPDDERQNVSCGYDNIDYGSDFDLDQWIRQYCPELGDAKPWQGGRKWIFEVCPFDATHTGGCAGIFQLPNGAMSFKCHHNHCSKYDWHSLRDLKEPNWRDKKTLPASDPDVDLSGIIGGKNQVEQEEPDETEEIPEEERTESSEYIPFPEELYKISGFVGKVMETTLQYAPVPNRPLALAGALTLMSFLAARKVKTDSGLRPNIYLLSLAKSGAGKEKPRDINQLVLESIGLDNCLLENVASGEGLEDMLVQHPALFWQSDEFYSVLHNMSFESADNRNSLMRYLLTLYTSSQKNFNTRAKVGKDGVTIIKPHLTLYASTTPNGFFDHLSERFLNDGMFARLNIIIAEEPKRAKLKSEVELPDEIIKTAKAWRDFIPPGSGNIDVEAMLVPYTSKAREVASDLFDKQYDICESIRRSDNPLEWKESVWNRYFETSMRYALIYACSEAESPEQAVITPEAIEWGSKFVKWEIENKIHMTEHKYYRTDFEKISEFVIDFMLKWHESKGNVPMAGWKFNRKMRFVKDKKSIIDNLVSQKRLIHTITPTRGRQREDYYLPQFAPGKEVK